MLQSLDTHVGPSSLERAPQDFKLPILQVIIHLLQMQLATSEGFLNLTYTHRAQEFMNQRRFGDGDNEISRHPLLELEPRSFSRRCWMVGLGLAQSAYGQIAKVVLGLFSGSPTCSTD